MRGAGTGVRGYEVGGGVELGLALPHLRSTAVPELVYAETGAEGGIFLKKMSPSAAFHGPREFGQCSRITPARKVIDAMVKGS